MIDGALLLEVDGELRTKLLNLIDNNTLKEVIERENIDVLSEDELIENINCSILMNQWKVIGKIEKIFEMIYKRERNNITNFQNAIRDNNSEELKMMLHKILKNIPFKDLETLSYVLEIEPTEEQARAIEKELNIYGNYMEEYKSDLMDKEKFMKTDKLDSLIEAVSKGHEQLKNEMNDRRIKIEYLERECRFKEEAIKSLRNELSAVMKDIDEDEGLKKRIEKNKNELEDTEIRMATIDNMISDKENILCKLDNEYNCLLDKKESLEKICIEYSKKINENQSNQNCLEEETFYNNENYESIDEKESIDEFISALSLNIEGVGLEEEHTYKISEYVVSCILSKKPMYILGYESLEIAKRIAFSYFSIKSTVVKVRNKLTDISEVISIIENSKSDLIIIEGLAENIDYTLTSLLPKYALENNIVLIITSDNYELAKFFGPEIINNYAIIIPSKYDIENRNEDYCYCDFSNLIERITREEAKINKENVIDISLDELKSIPDSYKISRDIILNATAMYWPEERKSDYLGMFDLLFEAELKELLRIRDRLDILEEISKSTGISISKSIGNREFF